MKLHHEVIGEIDVRASEIASLQGACQSLRGFLLSGCSRSTVHGAIISRIARQW